MPDILIAHRLMIPDRDLLFLFGIHLTVLGLSLLEENRYRIERYQALCQCRAARRNRRD